MLLSNSLAFFEFKSFSDRRKAAPQLPSDLQARSAQRAGPAMSGWSLYGAADTEPPPAAEVEDQIRAAAWAVGDILVGGRMFSWLALVAVRCWHCSEVLRAVNYVFDTVR